MQKSFINTLLFKILYSLLFFILTDGPDNISIFPSYEVFRLIENGTLGPIQCYADCLPECTFHWKKSGTPNYLVNPLTISTLRPADAGLYTCSATHPVKGYIATTNLELQLFCKYQ